MKSIFSSADYTQNLLAVNTEIWRFAHLLSALWWRMQ